MRLLVLEAPPGWGKTRLLARLLCWHAARGRRVLYSARTRAELLHAAEFCPGLLPVYGREAVCPRGWRPGVCEAYRELGQCGKPPAWFYAWLRERPRAPREIAERAAGHGFCPYTALASLARGSRAVAATHEYTVSNPWVLGGREVVAVDEAHSLLEMMAGDVVEAGRHTVEQAAWELRRRGRRRLAYLARSLARRMHPAEAAARLLEALEEAGEEPPRELLLLARYYRGELPGVEEAGTLHLTGDRLRPLLSAATALASIRVPRPVVEEAARLSGREPAYSRPRPRYRQRVLVDTRITTKWTRRGPELPDAAADIVRDHLDPSCGNLVVAVNQELAEALAARLGARLYAADTGRPPALQPGEVLVANAWSPVAEGVEVPGACRVIVLGTPYPPPTPGWRLLAERHGFQAIVEAALTRALQAVGRLRGRGLAVLADERYTLLLSNPPQWIDASQAR